MCSGTPIFPLGQDGPLKASRDHKLAKSLTRIAESLFKPCFFLGNTDQASTNLQKLRGSTKEQVQPELDMLKAIVAREFKDEPRIKDLWATRGNVKALGICVFLAMLLQLSGIDVLLFYMEELLVKVGTSISGSTGTIIMGVVQVCTFQCTLLSASPN